ncbi:MAG: rhodanese-like domain-containing protein [Phycisphaeraceae bacterium]
MNITKVSPREAMERIERDEHATLIDVRTPAEFEQEHAEGARLVSLDELDPERFAQERGDRAGEAVYVLCRTGSRAATAAGKLRRAGLHQVHVVEGGTEAWVAAGLPVKRGRRTMSLERQVRIAAGSLVLLSVVLGWLVHPLLYAIAAFVGGGLVFAGVTDTCGMGMLLARMPWNRRGSKRNGPKQEADVCPT